MANPFYSKGELKDEEVKEDKFENFKKANEFAINKKQEFYSKYDKEVETKKAEDEMRKMIEARYFLYTDSI